MKISLKLKNLKRLGLILGITFHVLIFSLNSYGQTGKEVHGIIKDATGKPLTGVSVGIKGTGIFVLSDGRGQYSISVKNGATLEFTYVGMEKREVSVGKAQIIDINLNTASSELDAVVVVGYGQQRKKDITGSITHLSEDQISKQPVVNIAEAIQGQVAGVQVSPDSYVPGAGVSVRVRGTRSITASNEPLYVVNGAPMQGALNDINPNDVASIEILKDASATAIYGSRGANGVVLITTKNGKVGKAKVAYNGYMGYQKRLRKVHLMNGEQFAEMKREANRTVGTYTSDSAIFYPEDFKAIQEGHSVDWQDIMQRTGLLENHEVEVSGGSEDVQYRVAPSYYYNKGITKGQDYKRYSFSTNLRVHHSRFEAGVSSFISNSDQNLGNPNIYHQIFMNDPLLYPFDSTGKLVYMPINDIFQTNILSDVANYLNEIKQTRILGSIYAQYKFLPGLTYRISFGPDFTYSRTGVYQGAETFARGGGNSFASYNMNSEFHYTLDNTVNFKRNFNNVHNIDVTLLYSIEKNRLETTNEKADQLPYDYQLFYNLGSASEILGIGSSLSEWQLQSYMGRINYSLFNKYLLTVTGRIDGSSRLAPGRKYGYFPSVAVGWIISDESFMKGERKTLSTLKLRVSYGTTGNTAIDPYQTLGSLNRTAYEFNGVNAFGYTPALLPNKSLQWETTHQENVGIDFGLWNRRVSGSIDFYYSSTNQLLLNRLLPNSTGFSNITSNIGKTKNIGLDFDLSTININQGSLKWTTDLNFSTNKNRIVDLFGTGQNDVGNAWFIGSPINVYYDYQSQGIWQSDQKDMADKYGVTPGTIRIVDQNNDGKINDADRVILGSAFPKWTAGMTNNFNYRNFDFSVFIVTIQGNMIRDPLIGSNGSAFTNFGRYNGIAVSYWTPTNPNNKWPRPKFDQETPLYGQTLSYMDGAFVRVKNVTLSYTLPKSLLKGIGLSNARLYIQGQNLYVFTDSGFIGYDPESTSNLNPPSPRSLLFGVNIKF